MTPILEGHILNSFSTFSNIAIILFLLQIYFVYNNLNNQQFEITGKLSKVTSSIMYLLGVLTLMCSLTMYTILKYFRTDGYKNLN